MRKAVCRTSRAYRNGEIPVKFSLSHIAAGGVPDKPRVYER